MTGKTDRITITEHNKIPGLKLGSTYTIGKCHHDVNGSWGSHRMHFIHYHDEISDVIGDDLIGYAAIGHFSQIGLWPEQRESQSHSRFRLIEWIVGLMEAGVLPDDIWSSVEDGLVAREIGNKEFRLNESSDR